MVPEERLEPSIPKEHDFESCAYTNSATPARRIYNNDFEEILPEANKVIYLRKYSGTSQLTLSYYNKGVEHILDCCYGERYYQPTRQR